MANEITYQWDEMETNFKALANFVLAKSFKTDQLTMNDILDMGNPKIVFADDQSYFRFHDESKEIMEVLVKNYAK